MEILYFFNYFFVFVLGTLVGSFLNVVILRFNTGVSFFIGRSFCASCGKQLNWQELIPIISFFILNKKCAKCGSKISWQYPAVEFATGVLFLATICKLGPIYSLNMYNLLSVLYFFTIWSVLLVIAVYDIRHKIIPDTFAYLFAGFSLVFLIVNKGPSLVLQFPHVWDLIAGPLYALPFVALWYFSKGKWMGLGDAKLALGIGWFLGLVNGGSAIILGFWIGAIVGLLLIVFGKISKFSTRLKGFGLKSEIPFGPFLIIGVIFTFFFGLDVFDLRSILL